MRQFIIPFLFIFIGMTYAQDIRVSDPLRYLALGDSYTIGQSVPEEERWPVQLAERLNERYSVHSEVVDIIARTGWTTGNLISAIERDYNSSIDYNLVSLLIGVNNQYQGLDIKQYRPDFRVLLEKAIAIAGSTEKVFVVSIPDYSYTPSHANLPGISEAIDDYNEINKSIANDFGVKYFDITAISREGLDKTAYVAADDLHPSGIQYSKWVDLMFEAFTPITSEDPGAKMQEQFLDWTLENDELSLFLPNRGGTLELFDATGRSLIASRHVEDIARIPVAGWAPGIYIVNYRVDKRYFTGKVFID